MIFYMLEFIIILFLSPIAVFGIYAIFRFIISIIYKRKTPLTVNRLNEMRPEITFIHKHEGIEVLIKNFRNVVYKTNEWDNVISWENKKFNLNELESLDIMLDHYAFLQSHSILVFNFLNNRKLCVSFELIHTDNQRFNTLRAIYETYQAAYTVGSYDDLVGVRFLRYANFDHNKLTESKNIFRKINIYRTNFTKEESVKIFLSIANDVNIYSQKYFKYNFIYRNCLSEFLNISLQQKDSTFIILNFSSQSMFWLKIKSL